MMIEWQGRWEPHDPPFTNRVVKVFTCAQNQIVWSDRDSPCSEWLAPMLYELQSLSQCGLTMSAGMIRPVAASQPNGAGAGSLWRNLTQGKWEHASCPGFSSVRLCSNKRVQCVCKHVPCVCVCLKTFCVVAVHPCNRIPCIPCMQIITSGCKYLFKNMGY